MDFSADNKNVFFNPHSKIYFRQNGWGKNKNKIFVFEH